MSNAPLAGYTAVTNGFYSTPPPPPPTCNPPYNDYPESCCSWLCRLFLILIGLVIIFGTLAFIVWLALPPGNPEFRVDSFSVSNFTAAGNNVSFNSEIRVTARNPNKKMTLEYGRIRAMIYHGSDSLMATTVPPLTQDPKEETSVTLNFVAAAVDRSVGDAINKKGGGGNVDDFSLRMNSWVSFVEPTWWNRWRNLKVSCADLTGLPPPKCHVRM